VTDQVDFLPDTRSAHSQTGFPHSLSSNPFTYAFQPSVCPIFSKAAAVSAVRFLKGRRPHLPSPLRARQTPDEREAQADPIRARRVRPLHRVLATCEVLRGLAYPAARAGDDDLFFDSRHEVLLSNFLLSHSVSRRFFSQVHERSIAVFAFSSRCTPTLYRASPRNGINHMLNDIRFARRDHGSDQLHNSMCSIRRPVR
jgi:hypothetical protein